MRIDSRLVAELRGLLPEYMAQKQILVGGKRRRAIHCINPEHNDRTPSMHYNRQNNTLHCFGCGVTYDLFDVIAMDYPMCDSFPKQVRKACELFGMPLPGQQEVLRAPAPLATAPAPAAPIQQTHVQFFPQVAQELLEYGIGGSYFEERGISQETCRRHQLYQTNERAVMPVFSQGHCVSWCARALRDDVQPRYKNSTGAMEIFGADLLRGAGKGGALFVTEAIFDALSVEECGHNAVALCGAANVRKLLTLCAENPTAANSYTWIAAGDADEAGRRMNAQLMEGLQALGIDCKALELPQGYKDLNEALVRDRAALKQVLDTAASTDRRDYEQTSAAAAVGELLDGSVRRAQRQAISTGFAALDDALDGGLYAGLYVLGAISSLGKTSYILQMADYITSQGTDVLFFSLEMSRAELMAKSISRISSLLDDTPRKTARLTARQVLRMDLDMPAARAALLNAAVEHYKHSAAGLFLREGIADIGAAEIREAVRAHIRLRGRRPVVMVDYLQILKPDDPRATDKQNTDRAVVALKRISRDFELPVLAVSSFNRENYRSAVSMEAFKESGAVEYSSDVLLGMQLAGAGEQGFDVNAAKSRNPRAIEVVMLKNRSGAPFARIRCAYDAAYNLFWESAEKGEKGKSLSY